MKRRGETLIKRFCDYMGRPHFAARLIDWIAIPWILPPDALPEFVGVSGLRRPVPPDDVEDELRRSEPMAIVGPGAEDHHWPPSNRKPCTRSDGTSEVSDDNIPEDRAKQLADRPGFWSRLFHSTPEHNKRKANWDATHFHHVCNDDLYYGMHGRPCKFEGGSDTKCPVGTVSGWFWSYDCPNIGKVFYVDCCSKNDLPTTSRVYCNNSCEVSWCWGNGRAHHTGNMEHYICTLSILDIAMRTRDLGGGSYEVDGVDPPP
jgi:hypothetical protein